MKAIEEGSHRFFDRLLVQLCGVAPLPKGLGRALKSKKLKRFTWNVFTEIQIKQICLHLSIKTKFNVSRQERIQKGHGKVFDRNEAK